MRHLALLFVGAFLFTAPSACAPAEEDDAEQTDEAITACADSSAFNVGSGIHDVTGPAEGLGMMGYAMLGQKTAGIHTRLWSRAHVIESPCTRKRVAFVSVDLQSVSQGVKHGVLARLRSIYGSRYDDTNVLISATHTHSGPGGYALYALYDLTIKGVNRQNFDAIVEGITESIVKADMSLEPASIRSAAVAADAPIGVNRSRRAYDLNPADERAKYTTDTNAEMVLLRFDRPDGSSPGVVNWYALHGTSMSNKNRLISGDNKGFASAIFERWKRADKNVPGTFVASFAQADEGDVSPTTPLGSNADGRADLFNVRQAGTKQFNLARRAYDGARTAKGGVSYVHSYVKFDDRRVSSEFGDGRERTTCPAALGLSMLAGTEDGKGFGEEGKTCGALSESRVIDLYCDLRRDPCQGEKPVVLTMGTKRPIPWTPEVLPLQILRVADTAIVGVPFELTTMAGRRVREQVAKDLAGTGIVHVVIAGLSNAYAGYVATREEYARQDYEGASTHFGPYELGAILEEVHRLASALRRGAAVDPGPAPRVIDPASTIQIDVRPREDKAPRGGTFGQVLVEPQPTYARGQTLKTTMLTSHPARNLRTMGSYLHVERKVGSSWQVVHDDDDPETIIRFERMPLPGTSAYTATIEWTIRADAEPGIYRIRHEGEAYADGRTKSFTGITREITVR